MATSNKRISLNTIAEQLGLSTSTVSRALADHAGISEATKARVRQLAEELHYLPNHLAASLRKGRSNTLGVIVPHINGYFFPAVMNGIEKVASQAGFNVMMCQSNEDVRRERQNIATLLAAQVEGIILSLSATTHEQVGHFEQVQQQGTPLVFFDRMPELPNSTAVVLDDFKGAYQAVTHLIEQGCTRIAHLAGPQQLNTSRNRFLGYQEALRAHGLPLLDELVYQLPSSKLEAGRTGMAQLLSLPIPPDGVFAAYAFSAAGALEALHTKGLRVPQDVAVACFSNEPFTTMTQPSLTAVDQRAEQMGETAVRLLLQLLKRGPDYTPPHIVLKPELLVRDSSLHLAHRLQATR
jgi:LacI family transcriptional regulator